MCALFLFWESQCGGELGQLESTPLQVSMSNNRDGFSRGIWGAKESFCRKQRKETHKCSFTLQCSLYTLKSVRSAIHSCSHSSSE